MPSGSYIKSNGALEPSSLVVRYTRQLIGDGSHPIADVACGQGRHAIYLANHGAKVVGIDRDIRIFEQLIASRNKEADNGESRLSSIKMDLLTDTWPIKDQSLSAIVNIHFYCPSLFTAFGECLIDGGHLLLQTPGGHGSNYLELPGSQIVKQALESRFEIEMYRERKVGPADCDAVSVSLFACRRARTTV